jgi:hypothetical protein
LVYVGIEVSLILALAVEDTGEFLMPLLGVFE